MLPFLSKIKKDAGIAGTIIKNRTPDEKHDENQEDKEYSLEDCAKDILSAIRTNDHLALASALKEAFQKLEEEPHEEGPHIEPHSYDASKE